ncbi:UNVERIFIED_CONTAM: hypothetical protein FKN15_025765, partial [Acipenser sinensis]
QVKDVMKNIMAGLQQTNSEKILLSWVRQSTQDYQEVNVVNFTNSWSNGLAFNALIHSHRPDLFEWSSVLKYQSAIEKLDHAFSTAKQHLGIEKLLDPEDIATTHPDKKSIIMYVTSLFQVLPQQVTIEAIREVETLPRHTKVTQEEHFQIQHQQRYSQQITVSVAQGRVRTPSPSLKPRYKSYAYTQAAYVMSSDQKRRRFSPQPEAQEGKVVGSPLMEAEVHLDSYQSALEEVLTWLLSAEDALHTHGDVSSDVEEVKEQFHTHEVGSDTVQRLHEVLMFLQHQQLKQLEGWLTTTEARINRMETQPLGPDLEDVKHQVEEHKLLQEDLETEQVRVNSLTHMVVVVDESSGDSATAVLEEKLQSLGGRWAAICKWTEERWILLQEILLKWQNFTEEQCLFDAWLIEKEEAVNRIQTTDFKDQNEMVTSLRQLAVLKGDLEMKRQAMDKLCTLSQDLLSAMKNKDVAQKLEARLEDFAQRWDSLVQALEKSSTQISQAVTTAQPQKKRQIVVDSELRKRFGVDTTELHSWMTRSEAILQSPEFAISRKEGNLSDLQERVNAIEREKPEKHRKLQDANRSAQALVEQMVNEGLNADDIKQASEQLNSRWVEFCQLLGERLAWLQYQNKILAFYTQLQQIEQAVVTAENWLRSQQAPAADPEPIKLQLEKCKDEVARLSALQLKVEKLKDQGKELKEKEDVAMFLEADTAALTDHCNQVLTDLQTRETQLNTILESLPPTRYKETVTTLLLWIQQSETRLSIPQVTVTEYKVMEQRLKELKVLQGSLQEQQSGLNYLTSMMEEVCQKAPVEISKKYRLEIEAILCRWKKLSAQLGEQCQKLEELMNKLQQFQALVNDIHTIQPSLNGINNVGQTLKSEAEPAFASKLQEELTELNAQWENICKQRAREEVQQKEVKVKLLTDSVNSFIAKAPNVAHEALNTELGVLTSNYQRLCSRLNGKCKTLEEVWACWCELLSYLEAENRWLDELELKLRATDNIQGGAEEISEALDSLESMLRHPEDNRNQIRELAQTLTDGGILDELINEKQETFNTRWDDLLQQAVRRQQSLEHSIQSAQETDKTMRLIQESLATIDRHLTAYITDRIDAAQIPTEAQTIQSELSSHESSLDEMKKRKLVKETSERVISQIDVTQKKLQEVSMKFRLFQKPVNFEQRLLDCKRTLDDVKAQLPLLEMKSVEQDVLQSQLDQCMKFYKSLSEVKLEVETVIKTGRQIVQKQQTENPKELDERLTALKVHYNEMGAQAVQKETEKHHQQLKNISDLAEAVKATLHGKENLVEDKVSLLNCNWIAVTSRAEEWLKMLLDYQKQMEIFDQNIAQITAWMYRAEILLDESEKQENKEEVLKCLKAELNDIRTKVEAVRDQAQDLIKNRGDHCREVIEPTLTELNQRFEALSRRIKTGKVSVSSREVEQYHADAQKWLEQLEAEVKQGENLKEEDFQKDVDLRSLRKKKALPISPQWYQYRRQTDNLLQWLDDIEKRVASLPDPRDEQNIKEIDAELEEKREDLNAVNRQAQSLSRDGAAKAVEPSLIQLNKRWQEIESKFAQFRRLNFSQIVSYPTPSQTALFATATNQMPRAECQTVYEETTVVTTEEVTVETSHVPSAYLAEIRRLLHSITEVEFLLNSPEYWAGNFHNFTNQEDCLKMSSHFGLQAEYPQCLPN